MFEIKKIEFSISVLTRTRSDIVSRAFYSTLLTACYTHFRLPLARTFPSLTDSKKCCPKSAAWPATSAPTAAANAIRSSTTVGTAASTAR